MAKTKIEWADAVWNPVTGCSKVSEGCRNCYAERMAKRLAGRFGYRKDDPFKVTFHPERLEDPLRWKKPQRVFVCSMGDIFHQDVKPEWIDAVLDVIENCPQHTFIILTKRPHSIDDKLYEPTKTWRVRKLGPFGFFLNLWLGVSIEDQPTADDRIFKLLKVPAARYVLSIEPMLGPVTLDRLSGKYREDHDTNKRIFQTFIDALDWVIVGGETGPGARPMHPIWARAVRDQCQAAGVPFFFKQWGEWIPADQIDGYVKGRNAKRYDWKENPIQIKDSSYRVGRKSAGSVLDDRIWQEIPQGG